MKLLELLKTRLPIIQAPMAGSDSPELVAAACNAGVLGSLGAQYKTPDEIRKAIAAIRRLTDRPFAVNLFVLDKIEPPGDKAIREATAALQQYYKRFDIAVPSAEFVKTQNDPDAQLSVLLDEKVPVFSFTLGALEKRWIDAMKANGTVVIGTATNVKEAGRLEAEGVDAITAQSAEAGGHRGTFIGEAEDSMIGAMALIPQVVDAVKVPVIAAGGIMDGRGIMAAFALGAQGVQMGTAFLTVSECSVHQVYKQVIVKSDVDDTMITKVFSGAPARGIKNAFMSENEGKPLLAFPFHNSLTRPIRKVANETGQIDFTNLWSGQSGRLARSVSTGELVEQLVRETGEVLEKLNALKI